MKKYLIIYHKEDNDGVVSGAMFCNYLLNNMNITIEDIALLPSDYNSLEIFKNTNTIEDLMNSYESIIMTDISINDPQYMGDLFLYYGSKFIWCDHHKPIIDESNKHKFNLAPGVRDITKSAILCAYEYLYDPFNERYKEKDIPELFRILSGWDSWSYEREGYEFEYVKAINKAFTIKFNLDFNKILDYINEVIDRWNLDHINIFDAKEFYDYGMILNNYDDIIMEDIIKNSGDKSWKVMVDDKDREMPLLIDACAIFHQGASNSTMFNCLKETEIQLGLVFKHSPNGNWVMSMYNINDDYWFHCGEFLKKKYNGGGHKGAAGCTLTQDQFINLLITKLV